MTEGERFNKLDCEYNKCGLTVLKNVYIEELFIYKDSNLLALFNFLALITVSILYLFLKIKDKYFNSLKDVFVADLYFKGKSLV